jgi:hypothetical protein
MTPWRVSPPQAIPLMLLVAAIYLGPEWAAQGLGATRGALEYIGAGTEATALWLLLLLWCWRSAAAPVCTWGAFEAAQRPLCRLMLPLDKPPNLAPDQTLCEAAVGMHMTWLSFAAAAGVAWLVWERVKHGR